MYQERSTCERCHVAFSIRDFSLPWLFRSIHRRRQRIWMVWFGADEGFRTRMQAMRRKHVMRDRSQPGSITGSMDLSVDFRQFSWLSYLQSRISWQKREKASSNTFVWSARPQVVQILQWITWHFRLTECILSINSAHYPRNFHFGPSRKTNVFFSDREKS